MAKKRKSTRARKTTAPRTVHGGDSKSFLFIVAGGFLVIVMSLYYMGAFSTTKNAMVDTQASQMDSETTDDSVMVTIQNYAYMPETITVKKGTTVTWTNADTVEHSATADDGSFDTGLIATGETGTHTFDKVGTFSYHCTPHPSMKAKIVVTE